MPRKTITHIHKALSYQIISTLFSGTPHIMNPKKTLTKPRQKAPSTVPQNRSLNLRELVDLMLILCPHKVEEGSCSRESLEKSVLLFEGPEQQPAIARREFKKKYNLTLDIQQPIADSLDEREVVHERDEK